MSTFSLVLLRITVTPTGGLESARNCTCCVNEVLVGVCVVICPFYFLFVVGGYFVVKGLGKIPFLLTCKDIQLESLLLKGIKSHGSHVSRIFKVSMLA